MTVSQEEDVVTRLSFSTRVEGDMTMLDFHDGGCRPASEVEIECISKITSLREENERLRRLEYLVRLYLEERAVPVQGIMYRISLRERMKAALSPSSKDEE